MKVLFTEATHYIDRHIGAVMHIKTDKDSKISAVDDDEYKGKLEARLKGLTIQEANDYLKTTFTDFGVWMFIKPLWN